MTMRTVTLELLRHGPAHNQLLSPLTPYLALCGNHDAETIHVSFEHLQLTRYIEQLRYAKDARMAASSLQDAAREVSRLLESIRCLTAELSSSDPVEGRRMIHLRLVLSASELAMLPFELATAHSGMPGQGQPLSLQTATPVCLTRETRRVAATPLQWPARPRILMVMAAPGAVSEVPGSEHLEKLQSVLAPYVDIKDPKELSQYLTLLSEATLEDVREACSRTAYTHVHILTHGIALSTGLETRFGLAFHAQEFRNEVDIVTGERLASALRCHMRMETGEQLLSSPAVVSIASCDSANVGSVVASGASVAHALHEQGIPMVVASQFPLSVKGSIIMTELLYRRLLEGDDPRTIIHDLRQALYAGCPDHHDWASLVVYAAFPNSLQSQVQKARFEMARRALEVMMAQATRQFVPGQRKAAPREQEEAAPQQQGEDNPQHVEQIQRQLKEAMARFEATAPKAGQEEQVRAWGVLASAWKQVADFLAPRKGQFLGRGSELLRNAEFRDALKKSQVYYYRCYQAGANEAWPLVQYLALTVGLRQERGPEGSKLSKQFEQLWTAAQARAEDNLNWGTPQQQNWAQASLVELALLSSLWREPQQCLDDALPSVNRMLEMEKLGQYAWARFDVSSLARHLLRYTRWEWGSTEMQALAMQLTQRLRAQGE
jgi:hypothetical protein